MSTGWSLRRRLLRRVVLGIGAGGLLGLVPSLLVLDHEMGELMDDSLRASARFSLALYQRAGAIDLPARTDAPAMRILDDGVEIIGADWPALTENGGQDVAGWRVFRVSDPASGISVEVGQSNEWRHEELLESVGWLLVMMLPVSLVMVVVVGRAVTSALRPATRFAERLQSRKPGDLSPVAAGNLPRELAPISQSMNLYLDRIRDHVEAERQFATHAAHELRTPIAAASAQAQLMAAGMAEPGSAARMVEALRRLSLLVDRLLQLSRAEAVGSGEAHCDLVRVTRMVIADTGIAAIFDDGDVETAEVPIRPEALALILGNLLRNARDHGTGDIRVRLRPGPVLTVSNRVAPDAVFHHHMFEKSARSPGTGLGLGIVQKIAGKEGIGLNFEIGEGRACVSLQF
ncbi:sensor histidine kinase [Paracoccus lutimaris]|uniref:histidine kinase n=1 Tax=Paracoccus lutimaris TaxID=1490030 RepID=A0A368YL98_9RHOB|nr:HAMP domain-containing sensor histidine kinase [Paracoccus lutimaris]RCW81013.1 two-component system OmpR family sensor kinase [Paracoccus lutimaris]